MSQTFAGKLYQHLCNIWDLVILLTSLLHKLQYSQPGSQYKWLSTLHSTSDHLLATYFHCSCGEIFRLLFDCWFFLFLLALLIFRTKKENELKPAIAAGLLWFVLRSSYSLACLPLSALPLRGWTGIIIIIIILSFNVANPIVISSITTNLIPKHHEQHRCHLSWIYFLDYKSHPAPLSLADSHLFSCRVFRSEAVFEKGRVFKVNGWKKRQISLRL